MVPGPGILVLISLIDQWHGDLGREFSIHYVRPEDDPTSVIAAASDPIRAVITNGTSGIDAATLNILPDLEIICSFSAGYEKVDVGAARSLGIAVTHGPGVNAASAADHAIGLMIACGRGIVWRDRLVRDGEWVVARGLAPTVSGKRLGIIGLGAELLRRYVLDHPLINGAKYGASNVVKHIDPDAVAECHEGRFGRAIVDGLDGANFG